MGSRAINSIFIKIRITHSDKLSKFFIKSKNNIFFLCTYIFINNNKPNRKVWLYRLFIYLYDLNKFNLITNDFKSANKSKKLFNLK